MKKRILWGISTVFLTVLVVFIWQLDFPSWTQLDMSKLENLSQTTVIYDGAMHPVAGLHNGENRSNISIDDLADHTKNAFVAIEDARFYSHCGIDIWRIGGAILSNIRAGGYAEGASTITQQLIKLTHLTSEKKLSRKAQEAWLALQLEHIASKDEILEMYLNVVYFGKGAYGIEAAAQTYFGKNSKDLTVAESALLAGIIKAPGSYAPHISMENALDRRRLVLNAMVKEGMIDQETATEAAQAPIKLTERSLADKNGGWYVDWVLSEAAQQLGISLEEVLSGGFHIYSAMQTDMQNAADRLFEDTSLFPAAASDGIKPEAALVAIDPASGEILGMVGGREYTIRLGLNRSTQIKRQPGSAFKPISVYAAAIDFLGMTPLSIIDDVRRDYNGYTPSNASGKEYGQVTLRQALSRSMNLASVDLITKTGTETAVLYAKRAGIPVTEEDNNLSLALGSLTDGVSPAQMSAAYAPLINGGYRVKPHAIRSIEDAYGNILYQFTPEHEHVLSEKSARMLTSILEDAVKYGTAKHLSGVEFPVAAKTGTVGESGGGNRDIWTVAYTPNVSVAVWMGFDQPDKSHLLPEGITGGTYPARLAASFLKKTEKKANGGQFRMPDGMTSVLIDGKALELYGKPMLASENTPAKYLLEELLPNEQLPLLTSRLWEKPSKIESLYVQTDATGIPVISFIAVDEHSDYRIIRRSNNIENEVGVIQGGAGEYISLSDTSIPPDQPAEYRVIARHRLFSEEGIREESDPSEWILYQPPGLLERVMIKNGQADASDASPLFRP